MRAVTTTMTVALPFIAACLLCSGCAKPEAEPSAAASQTPRPAGRFFVCIIDTSASMRKNDVHRYAEQGAKLAIALLGKESSFAAVTFNSKARVQCGLKPAGDDAQRVSLQKSVTNIPRMGNTNFIAALRTTRRHLTERLPPSSVGAVAFLTDGAHTAGGREEDIIEEIAFFTRAGWPIYSIALSEQAQKRTLQKMATRTGGAYFKADRAENLLSAFVDIVSVTEGLLVKRGPFEAATVMPGTKRLVYLIAKAAPRAEIAQVTVRKPPPASKPDAGGPPDPSGGPRPGAITGGPDAPSPEAVPAAAAAAPGPAAAKVTAEHRLVTSAVEARSYDNPRPGVWTAKTTGGISERITLLKPSFTLDFVDGRPRSKYLVSQEISFALLARAEEPGGLSGLREHSELRAEIKSEATDKVVDEFALEAAEEADAEADADVPFIFEGKTPAKLSDPEREETQTARLACKLSWAEGEPWTHEKIVSYQVAPAGDLFQVGPEKLDFGTLWSDSEPVSLEMNVMSRCEEGVFKISANGGVMSTMLSCDPNNTTFATARQEKITVTLDPSKTGGGGEVPGEGEAGAPDGPLGEVTGEVTVTLDYGDVSGKVVEKRVPARARILRFEGDDLEIIGLKPGSEVSQPLPYKVSPEVGLAYELGPFVPSRLGPDQPPVAEGVTPPPAAAPIILKLADAESGKAIQGVIPSDAAARTYGAQVTVSVAPEGEEKPPPPRKRHVLLALGQREPRLTVTEARQGGATLGSIRIQAARAGWNEFTVRLVPEHAAGSELALGISNLKGSGKAVIAKPYCISAVPKGEWDGTAIREGALHELTYRTYVSSDLSNGEYKGEIVMALVKDDKRTAEVVLPVTVEVSLGSGGPGATPEAAPVE